MVLSAQCEPLPFHRRDTGRRGYGRRALRGREIEHRRRAVYCPAAADPLSPRTRIADACADLPAGVVVGGWAAAWLHLIAAEGASGSRREELAEYFSGSAADGTLQPLLLCAPPRARLGARPGVRVFRSTVPESERAESGSGPLTSPVRTAFDLARLGPWEDAVIALDLLRSGLGLDLESLQELCRERRGWRGVTQVRRALSASEPGVESQQETRLRLTWVSTGLPRPRCNVLVGTLGGDVIARVDLIDGRAGVVGEYDGAFHSSSRARQSDAARQERLEDVGLVVVRSTADDVRTWADRLRWGHRLVGAYRRASERSASTRRWRILAETEGPVRDSCRVGPPHSRAF